MRRTAGAVLAALVVGLGAGCSDSKSGEPQPTAAATTTTAAPIPVGEAPVLLELIRPAIAAVEAELGAPQQYFEVNATPTLVNVFVAADDATKAIAYVYSGGVLQPPAAPEDASGPTFAAADVQFDETRVMATVVASLPGSTFRGFAVTGVDAGGVRYVVSVESTLGGSFEVTVGPTGAVLGTNQQMMPPGVTAGS